MVKWLASPINPLDINRIEGTYPGSEAPRIGGSEGIGVIEKAGPNSVLRPGDHVIPVFNAQIWTELFVTDSENLLKIRENIDLV